MCCEKCADMCYILCRKWSVDSGVVAQSPGEGDADINYGLVSIRAITIY